MRGERVGRIVAAAVAGAALLVSCGGGGGSSGGTTTTTAAAACGHVPLTMELTGADGVGSTTFSVTDAVARRIAIVPQGITFQADERSGLESQARTTPAVEYQVYLADFALSRSAMKAASTDPVRPVSDGGTYALVTISPQQLSGFTVGQEVTDGQLGYETIQPIPQLKLEVLPAAADTFAEPAAPQGQVKVVSVSDTQICLDIDVQMVVDGAPTATAKGLVAVPVVAVPPTVWLY